MRKIVAVALILLSVGAACTRSPEPGPPPAGSDDCLTTRDDDLARAPQVTIPDADPSARLQVCDVVVGTGPVATQGRNVEVRYVTVTWSDGRPVDSSWDRDEAFRFVVGEGPTPGWDDGIEGMRVGGRREIVMSPELAYGARGAGDVGPNETIVLVIDLVSVES